MQGKPKLTLKDFSGMGDNGMYWLEGFRPVTYNGSTVLTPGWSSSYTLSEDTSGFSAMTNLTDMARLDMNGDTGHVLGVSLTGTTNNIHSFHAVTAGSNKGLIHANVAEGTNKAGICVTRLNNLLYGGSDKCGVGYFRKVTSATSTSVTVSGETFNASYGISNAAGHNKVYNLTKKAEYTNTTASPTDTLNFTAPAVAPQAGDYIYVFNDERFDFGVSLSSWPTGNHFQAQPSPSSWARQIILYNDTYYMLNGNWLSSLNAAETTFTQLDRQLPYKCQAMCADQNQGQLLIGCEVQGNGKLLLWDGDTTSAGWVNTIDTEKPVSAIRQYGRGWVVMIGTTLYFTDGYNLQTLDTIPDSHIRTSTNTIFSSILTQGDKVLITGLGLNYDRQKAGVYVYEPKQGWAFIPIEVTSGKMSKGALTYALFNTMVSSIDQVFVSSSAQHGTHLYPVTRLYQNGATKGSALFYIKLPQKMDIGLVELNLSATINNGEQPSGNATVTVNYGDGSKLLQKRVTADTGSTTTSINNANGVNSSSSVGQLLIPVYGDQAGERTYITDIDNPGASNEILTISPALSSAITSTDQTIVKYDLYSAGQATVSSNAIPQELNFSIPSFYSDKLFLEVVVDGSASGVQLDIHSINIY